MTKGNILFIDNDKPFLDTWKIFLEDAGYKVFPAYNLQEADRILRFQFIQLILTDVRAQNDDDRFDVSGIDFARQAEWINIPKIILTAEPNFRDMREMTIASGGQPVTAINYMPKEDGEEALIAAVDEAFATHLSINKNLKIIWRDLSCVELLGMIEPSLGETEIGGRLVELESLIKTLFADFEQVVLTKILTGCQGAPKLLAYATNRFDVVKKYFVEVSNTTEIERALSHFETGLKQNHFGDAMYTTEQVSSSITAHYGAIAWRFRGMEPSQYYLTFGTMVRNRNLPEVEQTMRKFMHGPLQSWQNHTADQEISFRKLFASDDQNNKDDEKVGQLTQIAQMIVSQAAKTGIHDLKITQNGEIRFTFELADETLFMHRCLDQLANQIGEQTEPLLLKKGLIHNSLNMDTIFFDHSGKGWLTDFRSSELDQFVLIDSVRFIENLCCAWSRHIAPSDWVMIEYARLLADSRLEIQNPFWEKIAAVLGEIQVYAEEVDNLTEKQFLQALFWSKVAEIRQLKQDQLTTCDRIQGALNLLISAMVIGHILIDDAQPSNVLLAIDHANQAVQIGSNKIELPKQEYNLLCFLYNHANQAVSRVDIAIQVFNAVYDEFPDEIDLIEYNRITMTMSRLREKIDPGGRLGLISTVRGKGYRLNLPEDVNNNA